MYKIEGKNFEFIKGGGKINENEEDVDMSLVAKQDEEKHYCFFIGIADLC